MKLSVWVELQGISYKTAWRMWKAGTMPVRCEQLPIGTVVVHADLSNVRFAYGHEALVAALASSCRIDCQTKAGAPTVKRVGTALSYRFVRDERVWRIFVSVEARPVATGRAKTSAPSASISMPIIWRCRKRIAAAICSKSGALIW